MSDDSPFQRPKDRSGEPPDDDQAGFLDELTSLFDEEDEGTGLPGWDEPAAEATAAEDWESSTGATPRWRDDSDDFLTEEQPEVASVAHGTGSASVFEDPEPTEAVEFPSVDRVDEVLAQDVRESLDIPGIAEPSEVLGPEPLYATTENTMAETPVVPRPDDTITALVVGLVLGGVVLGAIAWGERPALAVLTVALLLAAVDWFTSLRNAGYQPPSLVGLAAVTAMAPVAYWRGTDGIVLVLVFALFGAGLWYLAGVGRDRPLANLGVTLLGVVYIGVAGAFGGLLLDMPNGAELVLSAVVLTVAHDVGAFAVGRAAGRTPLSRFSPNKTVEGLIGGFIATIATALILISIFEVGPFGADSGTRTHGVVLGVVVAVVAPLADLLESAVKRDLGVKDMGSLLPGHGGMLDRIDALLFVLPATYFTAMMLEVI